MSAGEDIGEKSLIKTGVDGIIVQDLNDGSTPGVVLRQVIYESKFDQIQSEVQLVYRDPKKKAIADNLMANSELCPKKKGKAAIINHDWLCNEY